MPGRSRHGRAPAPRCSWRRSGTAPCVPCTARIMARSSRAIWEGPSGPISTPAWEPDSRMFGLRDGGHPDEVVRAGEEGRERRGERDVVPDAEPDRRRDHLLLGDEHLEVAPGVRLGELHGVGGVADLTVEGHHPRPVRAQGDQRVAVRLTGGDLLAQRVRRWRRGGVSGWPWAWSAAAGMCRLRCAGAVSGGAAGRGRSGRVRRRVRRWPASAMSGGKGRPCQPSLSSTSENPRPLMVRARITVGWPPLAVLGRGERLVDLAQVVAVDLQHPGPERRGAAARRRRDPTAARSAPAGRAG